MAGVITADFQNGLDHDDNGLVSPNSETSEESGGPEEKPQSPTALNAENDEKPAEGGENVLVIDTSFTCKVVPPTGEPIDLRVSSEEIVQEIRNMLMDMEEQCHRTCFSLRLNGSSKDTTTLDAYTELKNIPGMKEGVRIQVIEDPYTVREARFHVKRIKEILTSCDQNESYTGANMSSLSFVSGVWAGDGNEKPKSAQGDSVDCTPPDYIMPKSKERPLLPLHPNLKIYKGQPCVKILTYDHWNPPPSNRKLHGDLLYLQIVTLEDKRFHATACTKGFFINESTDTKFDPRPLSSRICHHSLVELLSHLSPLFKKNWQAVVKKRYSKHIYERMPTPYQVFSWLAPQPVHTIDLVRMEDGLMTGRLGYEDNLPSGSRDWNEEYQIVKELPKTTLPERLDRERSHFKVNSDFVWAATRGAQLVVDGCLMPINPGEETKMQMFIWNNIFFSMGFDVKDHYKEFGGDFAAHVAPVKDLQGVRSYQELDIDGLCTLGTVVVDYRGYRVTAQSIIPGILEKEQEQSVVQGSIDFGKTIAQDDRYKDLLTKAANSLRIRPHKVVNHEGENIELYSSADCKGIVGNDGRLYILDLLRTFPADINYLKDVEDVHMSKELHGEGYPLSTRHKFVSLRQELVDAFVDVKYMQFVRAAAVLLEQQKNQKLALAKAKEKEKAAIAESEKKAEIETAATILAEIPPTSTLPKPNTISEATSSEANTEVKEKAEKVLEELKEATEDSEADMTEKILKSAATIVGSLSEKEFNIAFNPDLYQPKVTHSKEYSEHLETDKKMLNKAAEFLVFHQIPAFIQTCQDHTLSPIDGQTLTDALHARGINMRYLGRVAKLVSQIPTLSYVYAICVSEIVVRSAKHLFQQFMHSTDVTNLAASIAHFLNCLLSSRSLPHSSPYSVEATQPKPSKKKNKKGKKDIRDSAELRNEWAVITPKTLWQKLNADILDHFNFTLKCELIDAACDMYKFQKVSLLRAFCQTVGIQIELKEYAFDNPQRQPFYEEDIINMYPVVKHHTPKATDAYRFFTTGQTKISQGQFKEGYELILESLNLLSVYGPMHPEIAACCRLLARLNYLMGDNNEALNFQQRAVIMNERCLGIDSAATITDLVQLAIYSFAGEKDSGALQVLYRARYLLLLNHGEHHPEVALVDMNIGLILSGQGENELACTFLLNAKDLFAEFYGSQSLKVATAFHLLARSKSCCGDFRTALSFEKEAYTIYNQNLGPGHEKTRESSECLKHLTTQAVVFQKKMIESQSHSKSRGGKGYDPRDLTAILHSIQMPARRVIQETLNIVNGIAVPVSSGLIKQAQRSATLNAENKPELTAVSPASADSDAPVKPEKQAVADDLD